MPRRLSKKPYKIESDAYTVLELTLSQALNSPSPSASSNLQGYEAHLKRWVDVVKSHGVEWDSDGILMGF
jgi:hypothetical protein